MSCTCRACRVAKIREALDYARTAFETACDCGECGPCTDGAALLLTANDALDTLAQEDSPSHVAPVGTQGRIIPGITPPVEEISGATFHPWTNGWAIGYRVEFPDERVTHVYLNPSGETAEGVGPDVFVYIGPDGDPSTDPAQHWYDVAAEGERHATCDSSPSQEHDDRDLSNWEPLDSNSRYANLTPYERKKQALEDALEIVAKHDELDDVRTTELQDILNQGLCTGRKSGCGCDWCESYDPSDRA